MRKTSFEFVSVFHRKERSREQERKPDRHTDSQPDRQTERKPDRHTDLAIQTYSRDSQAHGNVINRQTQTETQIDRETGKQ